MTKSVNLQANRRTLSQIIQDQITLDLLNVPEQSFPDRTTLGPTTIKGESGEKREGLPLGLVLERDLAIEIEVGMIFTLEQPTVAQITTAGNLTQNTVTLKTADVVPTSTGTLTKTDGLRTSTTEILKAAERNLI